MLFRSFCVCELDLVELGVEDRSVGTLKWTDALRRFGDIDTDAEAEVGELGLAAKVDLLRMSLVLGGDVSRSVIISRLIWHFVFVMWLEINAGRMAYCFFS